MEKPLARQFERSSVIDALEMLVVTGRQMQSEPDAMTPERILELGRRVENHSRYAIDYLHFLSRMGRDPN